MTWTKAAEQLTPLGTLTVAAPDLKKALPEVHEFIGWVVHEECHELWNDVFRDAPDDMLIQIVFGQTEFTVTIEGSGHQPWVAEYKEVEGEIEDDMVDALVRLLVSDAAQT